MLLSLPLQLPKVGLHHKPVYRTDGSFSGFEVTSVLYSAERQNEVRLQARGPQRPHQLKDSISNKHDNNSNSADIKKDNNGEQQQQPSQ